MKKYILLIAFSVLTVTSVRAQSCPDENHPHAIDLGLPSGTKWACCNVGASKPEDFGKYYVFSETEEREIYDYKSGNNLSDFKYTKNKLTKSCDVATVKWGELWKMPTPEQIKELFESCTSEWKSFKGANGRRFTGKNGKSVFIPAGGKFILFSNESKGKFGHYWSNTQYDYKNGYYFYFYDGKTGQNYGSKFQGLLVRPVTVQ